VTAAGRTDTGVHALGQVVHFDSAAVRPAYGWVRGLNSLLPASIAVDWAQPVVDEFHARFSASARTYQYVLQVRAVRSPHLVGRAGWFYLPLDLEAMRAASAHLVGEHDFSALRSAQCQAKTPVKTVHSVEIAQRDDLMVVTLRADAFLHHMVRNVLGCLIAVGRGKYPSDWMAEVLASRDRARAAPTFMADGLYLTAVEYPPRFGLPATASLDSVFPGLGGDR
jgi:tRNA pseudouridine38-40 synthase